MPKNMTTIDIGQVTVGNPAVLVFTGTLDGMVVKAPSTNSGNVYIVDNASGDDTTGFELAPGEAIVVDQYTTGTIYAYGSSPDTVCYIGGQ